jgi:hypothetical protein
VAIYHLSIKIISRGKGKPAIAAAAYRAAEKITSEYDGKTHDYSRKCGVVHKEILLPAHAPREYQDRAVLWNAVEKSEKNSNAQLSREIEISLPVELTMAQNISLARRYVNEQFVSAGMCADLCVHDKGDSGSPTNEVRWGEGGNPHAHIMLTVRPIDERGNWAAKSRKEYILNEHGEKTRLKSGAFKSRKVNAVDWNEPTKAEEWRSAWANAVNAELERRKVETRIDHRSYERQGIEQIPTIHLGVAAAQMERKGIRTERGNINREIEFTNKQIRQLRARINHIKAWLKSEAENPTPPSLADIISDILSDGGSKTRYAKIRDLKGAAKVLNFLTNNNISTLPELREKVSDIYGRQLEMSDKFKPIDRRLKTLDEHIKHSENFKAYRGCKARYDKLYAEYKTATKAGAGLFAERKAKMALENATAYYEANRAEITLCEAAERYLKDVLQARFDPKKLPPITKWKEERAAKTAEMGRLQQEYLTLKDEIREVEIIRKAAEDIARQIDPPQKTRARETEI